MAQTQKKYTLKTFKYGFTLKQFAALALATNWAQNQATTMQKSPHYVNLFDKKMNNTLGTLAQTKIGDDLTWPEILNYIRNAFSHFHTDPARSLNEQEAESYQQLVKKMFHLVNYEIMNTDTQKDETREEWKKIYSGYQENPSALFDFRAGLDCDFDNRFELCFMFAPYLTKGQMAFVFDKLLTERDREEEKTKTEARKRILRRLAQHENIILRTGQDEDKWCSDADEQAFALWEQVRQKSDIYNSRVVDAPKSEYLIRQYVEFIQHHKILPAFNFGYIETHRTESEDGRQLIDQKTVFLQGNAPAPEHEDSPAHTLRIRHKTVLAQHGASKHKINFGERALFHIVAAFLKKAPGDTKQIEAEIIDWLDKNSPQKLPLTSSSVSLHDRLSRRLESLIHEAEQIKQAKNLQLKIRFICKVINRAHQQATGKALSSSDYKALEDKVRFYRKEELRTHIKNTLRADMTGPSAMDCNGIQMGRNNEKALKNLINKEELNDLCADLADAHLAWLKAQSEALPQEDSQLQKLANEIAPKFLKKAQPKTEQTEQKQPLGIPPRIIRGLLAGTDNRPSIASAFGKYGSLLPLENLPRNLSNLPNKQAEQNKHNQLVWSLLLAMSAYCLKKHHPKLSWQKTDTGLTPLSEMPITFLTKGDLKISTTLGNSWRQLIRQAPTLGRAYLPKGGTVRLHRPTKEESENSKKSTSETDSPNIHDLLREKDGQAFLCIQAILQWEQQRDEKKIAELKQKTNQPYLGFSKLAEMFISDRKARSEIIKMRNAAFHQEKPPAKKFCEAPEPIATLYKKLEDDAKEKQKKSQQARRNRKR